MQTHTIERYKNLSGNSRVLAYGLGEGNITVAFQDGPVYFFNEAVSGQANIARMRELARAGQGLGCCKAAGALPLK